MFRLLHHVNQENALGFEQRQGPTWILDRNQDAEQDHCGPFEELAGISSQVLPSRIRPDFFLFLPPHCLKKNGTLAREHWSRRSTAQEGSIGRDFGPDSPPTITQSIPLRSRSGNGPSNGSSERNLSLAFVLRKSSIREQYFRFSTLTPIHTFAGHEI